MANTFHRVGHGPHPVIVLHGWFGDAHAFEPIEPWLSGADFSYVFMDYRGYGGMREAAGEHSIDEIAADALALADALGFERFSLVGHSMGGMAIERVAALAPERVRALVAVAPVPCGGVAMAPATRALFDGAARSAAAPSSTAAPAGACRRHGWRGRPTIPPRIRRRPRSPRTCPPGSAPISATASTAAIRCWPWWASTIRCSRRR